VVHLISYVSMLGVAIGTAALVIVLSVFNGFESLILSLYNSFDPPIKITAVEGKVFDPSTVEALLQENELLYTATLEEKVMLKYKDKEYIATLKGVDQHYAEVNEVDSMLIAGHFLNDYDRESVAVIGQGVAYYLSMGLGDVMNPLQLFVPNRSAKHLLNPSNAFVQEALKPVGVFAIQADFDANYVLTKLSIIQRLLEREGMVSAIEVSCTEKQLSVVKEDLQSKLGAAYKVEDRYQQHAFLYQLLQSEKLAVFLILSFILLIATFNIIGSLWMLILQKKKDISTLSHLGLSKASIQRLFWFEGMLTTGAGAVFGLLLGLLVCWSQLAWGWLSMGDGSFVVEAYPLEILWTDILVVLLTVSGIGAVAAWIPAKNLSLD
jgi:lipoprotein-releasing system permease protein